MANIKTIEDVRRRAVLGRNGSPFVFGNVHHFRALNYRLEYGKETERLNIREALARYGGWDPSQVIDGENPLPQQAAIAVDERRALYESFKLNAAVEGTEQVTYQTLVEIFQNPAAGFMDEQGNILPPLQIGITGNRRSSEYLLAMVAVAMDSERSPEGVRSLNFEVPCNVPVNVTETIQIPVDAKGTHAQWVGGHYVRNEMHQAHIEGGSYVDPKGLKLYIKDGKVVDAEGKPAKGWSVGEMVLHRFPADSFWQKLRAEVQMRENTGKLDGFLHPTDAEQLIIISRMVNDGAIQADIRRHFQKSESVKALRFFFGGVLGKLDIVRKWNLGLYRKWTNKPYLNDDPKAPESQRGKPTSEPTYVVGQGAEKTTVANRANPDYLAFSDFDQAAFQGIADTATGAPEELKQVPVGTLATLEFDLDPNGELLKLNERRRKDKKEPVNRLTKPFLETWIEYVTSGGETTVSAMSAKAMKTWGGSLQNEATRAGLMAVRSNNRDLVIDTEKRAEGCNAMIAMSEAAYGPISKAMDKLANLPTERQVELAAQIAALLEAEAVAVPAATEESAEAAS